jgi:hypothetical protein
MGAYNIVKSTGTCPSCGRGAEFNVQFKYGNVWQYEYHVGDPIKWGGNDRGKPGYKRVIIDAIAEECQTCGAERGDYEVRLENDRIISVQPASGKYDFASIEETFIIIER